MSRHRTVSQGEVFRDEERGRMEGWRAREEEDEQIHEEERKRRMKRALE